MTESSHLKIIHPDARDMSALTQDVAELDVKDFNVWFYQQHILDNVNLSFPKGKITCIVGPSGSGKSTLIRSMNRINDETPGFIRSGTIGFQGQDIYTAYADVTRLRRDIGMVFQKPTVFPVSILQNVLFGMGMGRSLTKLERLTIAEENLKAVSLWKEVAHRLDDRASTLSGGQQQRLCLARALAMRPKVLLLDEPTASVDPVSGRVIEDLLLRLKQDYTLIVVTHDLGQMRRIADYIVFMCDGKLIEHGGRDVLLSKAGDSKIRTFLNDSFCEC